MNYMVGDQLHTPAASPTVKETYYPLNRMMGKTQRLFGHFEAENSPYIPTFEAM